MSRGNRGPRYRRIALRESTLVKLEAARSVMGLATMDQTLETILSRSTDGEIKRACELARAVDAEDLMGDA